MILLKEADLYDQLSNKSTLPEISNFFTFIPCNFRICRHILCSNCITGNRDIAVCYNRIDGYAVSWTNLLGARTDAKIKRKDDYFRESRRSALRKKNRFVMAYAAITVAKKTPVKTQIIMIRFFTISPIP